MAGLDEGGRGVKLRAGLPKSNGLVVEADSLCSDPSQVMTVIATVKVDDIVHHVATDSQTAVLRILNIEPAGDQAMKMLRKAYEKRTGQAALPGIDEPEDGGVDPSTIPDDEDPGNVIEPEFTGGRRRG
jgi:hypothetical protein